MIIVLYFFSLFEFTESGEVSVSFASTAWINNENTNLNPAILPFLKNYNVSLLHTNPYSLMELNYNQLSLNFKTICLNGSLFGSDVYKEWLLSIGLGFKFSRSLSYGIKVKGMGVSIKGYGNRSIPGIDIGILYYNNRYGVGGVLSNLNRPSIAGDFIPLRLSIGTFFNILKDINFGFDFVKEEGYRERILAGMEFLPISTFSIQVGLSTNPFLPSFGLAVSFKKLRISYGVRFHSQLGGTHLLSLGILL